MLIILSAVLSAAAQRTMRRDLKATPSTTAPSAAAAVDTVIDPEAHTVEFNGYDKPLRSRRESFFVTNNGRKDVCAIAFTVSYFDTRERLLHRQSRNLSVDIPAGETRQLSFPSWDVQQSFYYQRSTAPERVEQATPYEISVTVDTLFVR